MTNLLENRREMLFEDDFNSSVLDRSKWLAHYLPHWSAAERTRPRYRISDSCLTLRIDPDQLPWSPEFNGAVKVSNLQTGQHSGPVGSPMGQHRFMDGLTVREQHPEVQLFLFQYGRREMRAKANIGINNVAALWLIGFEDQPDRSGELCVVELKGWEQNDHDFLVGYGIKPFHDPALALDFRETRISGSTADFHTYSVEWTPENVNFFLDGAALAQVRQSPKYPMQLMLNLYELGPPEQAEDISAFTVDYVRVWSP